MMGQKTGFSINGEQRSENNGQSDRRDGEDLRVVSSLSKQGWRGTRGRTQREQDL